MRCWSECIWDIDFEQPIFKGFQPAKMYAEGIINLVEILEATLYAEL